MAVSQISREKVTYWIVPMQQNRIRIIGLSVMCLASILGYKRWQQNATQHNDRSTTCNCILEARTELLSLIPASKPQWRPAGVPPTLAAQQQRGKSHEASL